MQLVQVPLAVICSDPAHDLARLCKANLGDGLQERNSHNRGKQASALYILRPTISARHATHGDKHTIKGTTQASVEHSTLTVLLLPCMVAGRTCRWGRGPTARSAADWHGTSQHLAQASPLQMSCRNTTQQTHSQDHQLEQHACRHHLYTACTYDLQQPFETAPCYCLLLTALSSFKVTAVSCSLTYPWCVKGACARSRRFSISRPCSTGTSSLISAWMSYPSGGCVVLGTCTATATATASTAQTCQGHCPPLLSAYTHTHQC